MSTILDDLAAALGVDPLSTQEQQLLLDATRDVAHGSERRFAPLTAFLIGVAAASAIDRAGAIADAVSAVRAVLPAAAEDPPDG